MLLYTPTTRHCRKNWRLKILLAASDNRKKGVVLHMGAHPGRCVLSYSAHYLKENSVTSFVLSPTAIAYSTKDLRFKLDFLS